MLELENVSKAFDRVEIIYDKKNPLLRKFLNSAKKDKTNLYTEDMNEILNLTADLNDSIEKSIGELQNLKYKLPNSKLIETTVEYLDRVSDYENDMPLFLKLITDSIENNHFEVRDRISDGIARVNSARFDYQSQLDKFYRENNFTKKEIDSLIGKN
ncbi:hypothetical protein BST85_13395 [Aureitalea marina]|uniref:Uncharacterized protein n=2 Tax=Aureitalea marina TaxID=930804 RepID=A0A2S7KT34_9FLAO|nr:hypothetical protein BST85_13395 [Aureitalea marina]